MALSGVIRLEICISNIYIILYGLPPFNEEYCSALVNVITYVWFVIIQVSFISVASGCADGFISLIWYNKYSQGEFQRPVYVTAANLKSLSFVCLTSKVTALCLASCFEVCPQQHGQCSFCCPSVIFVWDRPSSIFLASLLGMGDCSAAHSLSLSRQNKQLGMEAEPDLNWSDILTVLCATSNMADPILILYDFSGFCGRLPVFIIFNG